MFNPIPVGPITIRPGEFFAIAGPCVIESETQALEIAKFLAEHARQLGIHLIFKASFDKANRSSLKSYRGPGFDIGMKILQRIRAEVGVPILSDVHWPAQAEQAAPYLDVLQVPALLSRQTDLLLAAARTGKAVNIKKGQFMAPRDMGRVIEKIAAINPNIMITERGVSFGYNNLVVDMRSLAILKTLKFPVVFDATHSVQLPGGGVQSDGQREFVPVLARAAAGAGIDGLFLETHPKPEKALSDGASMLRLNEVPQLWQSVLKIYQYVQEQG